MMNTLKKLCLFLVVINSGLTAYAQDFTKLTDGIEIKIKNPMKSHPANVRIQVVSDNIFHITASPTSVFTNEKSLMLDSVKNTLPKWTTTNDAISVTIASSGTTATFFYATNSIVFRDKSGNIIAQEAKNESWNFKDITLEGQQSYIVHQSFASDEEEALYGLGQHQNGVFNYKGTPVLLSQYNTEVGVPFVVSSKNYGILWDNNSITKSIDTRDFEKLGTLKLFSKEGNIGWLTATYYDKKDPQKIIAVRPESFIDYSYIPSLKNLPEGVTLENVTVTWEGAFETGFTGEHLFNLWASGYVKLYIDGKLLADKWRQGWNSSNELLRINFEKGSKHTFKLEWDPTSNESFVACKWLKPLSEEEKNEFSFESEAGNKIDYYFISGSKMDDVISGYRLLTGKATLMPKWAMGFWQSRERYKTQDEILEVAAEFRKRKIGLDNIVLDWRYWREGQWGSQEFDTSRFPDASAMTKILHQKYNIQIMISVWAKFYEDTQNYKDLKNKGFILDRNVVEGRKDWLGFKNAIYDAYNPSARKEFWNLINKKIYSKGFDAWWMDASEPDIHSNMPPEVRKEMIGHNFLGAPEKNYNAFSLENAEGIYEGQRNADPDKRVFLLTRSGFAGLQRYAAATWSGDIGSRWEDLRHQIPAGLNFSMSGLPYWTSDIGGFSVETRYENATGETLEEWRELNARWYQYGAFCPLFRAHGQFPYREIYNIAPENHPAYKSILYYNKLRYRLMPYIYSIAGQSYHNDYTIMRGLPMDFNSDKKVLNIGDQFMFGPDILVNPVYEYKKRSREVYLPNTTGWYNFYTNEYLEGGQTIQAKADYEQVPVFIKEGAIIPFGPVIEYALEKNNEPFTIYVYTGRDGSFTLYEDENINYNYEKGKFATITFNYNEASKTLTIEDCKGSFNGMKKNRVFNVVFIGKANPASLNLDSKSNTKISTKYTGKKVVVKAN